MDEQTALVLSLQLVALCCIAAALLLYLVCRMRGRGGGVNSEGEPGECEMLGAGRAVLVTSCDTALGLHTALYLSARGYRVFAGLRDREGDSPAARVLRARCKERDGEPGAAGTLVTLQLDVTREDLLHEAVGAVRSHLPAGEDGLWAVVNTAGLCCRGRLEQQESTHWDAMLKQNVVGSLRTARTFMTLLRNKQGRLLNIGASINYPGKPGTGLVAYLATRYAVEGASAALRHEMAPHGIHIITLQPEGIAADVLFAPPRIGTQQGQDKNDHTVLEVNQPNQYLDSDFSVLPPYAMRTLEEALITQAPRDSYQLMPHRGFSCLNRIILKTKGNMMCLQSKKIQST